MPQPKKYRHYFRYWDGSDYQYYFVVGGLVDIDLAMREISHAPDGWQEYELSLERGYTYFATQTSYTTPIKWYRDAAQILRHIYTTQGTNGKCQLYVEILDESDWTYSEFFKADFDFNTFLSEFDWVQANAVSGGFMTKLMSREDTEYELDLDGHADTVLIYNDGLVLQSKIIWGCIVGEDCNTWPTLFWIDTEGTNITFNPFTQSSTDPHVQLLTNHTAATADVEMTIDWNFDINQSSGYTAYLEFDYVIYNLTTFTTTTIVPIEHSAYAHASGTSHNYSGTNTQTISIPTNSGIFVMIRMHVTSPAGYVSDGSYSCTINSIIPSAYFTNRFEATYHPVRSVMSLATELIDKINDDATTLPTLVSTLMTDTYSDAIKLSSGDGIRNLEGSKIKLSFKTLFQFLRTTLGACFDYDYDTNTCYIEHLNYAYTGSAHSTITTLGEVKSMKVVPFTSELFTNLKIGNGTYTYDEKKADEKEITNGKDEPNTTVNWLSPLVGVNKVSDYVSPVRHDPHGAELIRINLEGKELADSNSDSDLFAFHTNDVSTETYTDPLTGNTFDVFALYRKPIELTAGGSYWVIENIFSPESFYNILFSPLRCLYRNGEWFRSLLKFNDAEYLKFQTTGKNNANSLKMITREGVGPTVLDEGADVAISSLCADGREYFYPMILEIETKEPIKFFRDLVSDRFSFIPFKYLGQNYKGYVKQATSKPTLRPTNKLYMLPTIDTDITQIER